jgi:hypothetical protein
VKVPAFEAFSVYSDRSQRSETAGGNEQTIGRVKAESRLRFLPKQTAG